MYRDINYLQNKGSAANTAADPWTLFLIPVVPDVLHIVIIFHDVDELFHQLDVLFGLQLLIVLGNHFDLRRKTLENQGDSKLFGAVLYKMA